jgi:predicted MFS family arabinose efflux permease
LPAARAAFGYATYQVAFAFGIGGGGALAGFLYEADPLLPLIVTAALALPIAAMVATVLVRTSPPREDTAPIS